MDQFLSNIHSSSITLTETFASIPGVNVATPIIALVIAVYLSLFGYKFKKVTMAIVWFIFGFILASTILPMAIDGISVVVILLVGVILGSIFAFLGFQIEQVAIFVAVTYLAFSLLSKFIHVDQEVINFMIKGIISAILGGIALSYTKPIFILVASLYAGSLVYIYLPELVPMSYTLALIIGIAVTVIGIATQFSITLKDD